jgi:hypothetical protein
MPEPTYDHFGRITPTTERKTRSPIYLIGLVIVTGALVFMVIS